MGGGGGDLVFIAQVTYNILCFLLSFFKEAFFCYFYSYIWNHIFNLVVILSFYLEVETLVLFILELSWKRKNHPWKCNNQCTEYLNNTSPPSSPILKPKNEQLIEKINKRITKKDNKISILEIIDPR